jgi:antitoxin component of RelBE/YafQ-DinJ toxin-antitoxin module
MAFELKPEDFGIVSKVAETTKKAPDDLAEARSYLKNSVSMIKEVKSGAREVLSLMGLTPQDAGKMLKARIFGQSMPQNEPQKVARDYSNKLLVSTAQPLQVPKIEEKQIKQMEKINFDKIMSKVKLVVKLMKAQDMKVSEFLELLETEKEDIKEILE